MTVAPAPSGDLEPIEPLVLPGSSLHRSPLRWRGATSAAVLSVLLILIVLLARFALSAKAHTWSLGARRRRGRSRARGRAPLSRIGAAAVVLALLGAGLALGRVSAAPGDVITTYAGGGPGSTAYGGDDGQATQARLLAPAGVASGPNGDVFIADTANHRIRRVSPTGVITTFAGTGVRGVVNLNQQPGLNIGDDGPAVNANLYSPTGIAVAPNGDVYFADAGNKRVRRVGTDGIITTVIGLTSTESDVSDGVRVATRVGLGYPVGVALNGAVLFVSDADYSVVFKVDVSLPPGTPNTARYAGWPRLPSCSTFGCTVGRDAYSGDGLQAREARLNRPHGLAVDAGGNLFIADTYNNRIRKVDAAGVITTVAGTGAPLYDGDDKPAFISSLSAPEGVATAPGRLVIADTANNRVREVGSDGRITTVAGDGTAGLAGDGGPGPAAKLRSPAGVGTAGANVFIADSGNDRVRLLAPPVPPAVTAPGAPTDAAATAGDASATVTWTAPASDGGSPLTSYTVTPYVGDTAKPATTLSGSPPPTNATVSGLDNGTTYTFTVTATNAVGSGPASARSNAVTQLAPRRPSRERLPTLPPLPATPPQLLPGRPRPATGAALSPPTPSPRTWATRPSRLQR